MTRPTIDTLLAPAPAAVRASMIAAADTLRPGAAAVVGRFFAVLAERGEHWTAPSRASFDAAAQSEATLHTLIKTLESFAPQVVLSPGREARKAWYARRPKPGARRRKGAAPIAATAPAHWPQPWRDLYPGLRDARISPSSIRRYIASINRCAEALHGTDAPPDLGFYSVWCVFESLRDADLKHGTIASYIDGLNALALHGGRNKAARAGLIQIRVHVGRLAELEESDKIDRIRNFVEGGGFETIARTVRNLRDAADAAPDWTAPAERARQTAAILAVAMNAPARTGDVAAWILGRDLIRHPSGDWELAWTQEKTGREADFGVLWPEVCELLDDLILAGRPDRLVLHRYREVQGMNWLTLGPEAPASRWPSEQAKRELGIPLHDLRTVAADYLRWHDPATAAATIQALLGHGSQKAGERYHAMTEGEAATRDWAAMRAEISRTDGRSLAAS